MPPPGTERDREQRDSLDALEPMGPHPEDYHRIDSAQALTIAKRMEDIFQNQPGIATQYHQGVNKAEHRWALYQLYQARLGTDAAGQALEGGARLDMLNRGLGPLQPVLSALPAERRAELASQASEIKRTIGTEIGNATRNDPEAVAGAEQITGGSGVNPRQLVTSLGDVIARGKAVEAQVRPGVEMLEAEKAFGDVALGKVKMPGPDGVSEFDFAGVRSMQNLVRVVDMLEGFVKLQEAAEKDPKLMDGPARFANALELMKVSGQVTKGVLEVGAMTARGIARMKGADDVIKQLDGVLAMGDKLGKVFSAVDAVGGVFTLLSDTSTGMEKADAVKNIAVFSVEALEMGATAAGAGAEGTALAGTALGSTASFLAHWGGPVATSIALTWEMMKWIGAETHEFHVTFSAFMMNHAFRTLAHHGGEIGKHGSKLAALARRMEEEQDPDVRAGILDVWTAETRRLAAEVKAVARVTAPSNDYTTPGAYWTIQQRFAGIRSNYAGVEEGEEVVAGSIECLIAIKDVLTNSDDYVDRERQRDPAVREQAAGAE